MKPKTPQVKSLGIKFCPRCKSTNVERPISVLTAIGILNPWKCNSCGFQSNIFPELTNKQAKRKSSN